MSWTGRWWRVSGILITTALLYAAWGEGLLMMAGYGFAGLAVFFVSWTMADRYDHKWMDR